MTKEQEQRYKIKQEKTRCDLLSLNFFLLVAETFLDIVEVCCLHHFIERAIDKQGRYSIVSGQKIHFFSSFIEFRTFGNLVNKYRPLIIH